MPALLSQDLASIAENGFARSGKFEAELRRLLIGGGRVERALVAPADNDCSVPAPFITVIENRGVVGDRHSCLIAEVDSRDDVLVHFMGMPKRSKSQTRRGLPKANLRQVTAVSDVESATVARYMGLPGGVMPLGAQVENLVLSGLSQLSTLPAGSRLTFLSPAGLPRTASLYVSGRNAPCGHPQGNILRMLGISAGELAKPYIKAAKGLRGITLVVETAGTEPNQGGEIHRGDFVLVWRHN